MEVLDQIKIPIDTRAYNETKELHHDMELETFRGDHPNLISIGFHDGHCYQRPHGRDYIKRNMHTFLLTVMVTLPGTHATGRSFGDILENGLFVIGGAWNPRDLESG